MKSQGVGVTGGGFLGIFQPMFKDLCSTGKKKISTSKLFATHPFAHHNTQQMGIETDLQICNEILRKENKTHSNESYNKKGLRI